MKPALVALIAALGTLVFILIPLRAPGAPQIFNLVAAQSTVTLSGTIDVYGASASLQPQDTGSLATSYSGTINADFGNSQIQFTGGSSIAALNDGSWQPAPGGSDGEGPADYGGTAQFQISIFTDTAYAAMRNVVLDVNSASLSISNGVFDTTNLLFSFSTNIVGAIDYLDDFGDSGSDPLSGSLTDNGGANAYVTMTNGLLELIIPVSATYVVGNSLALDGTVLYLDGQFVAVQAPPPWITSAVISQHVATVTATNTTSLSHLQSSLDLATWQATDATATYISGTTIFVLPATNLVTFYRVER